MSCKVVICGAGFLGSYIARELGHNAKNLVHIASRSPLKLHAQLQSEAPFSDARTLGEPATVDITHSWDRLVPAFEGANTVVSLVGILHGSPQQFEKVQLRGSESVARAAKEVGARLVHFSAIGANETSNLPYFRTKGLAEKAVFEQIPKATVIRPSLVFGPGDGFFTRFAKLSKYLPFMPVFGGGTSRFQPVYAGDIARFVSMCVDNGSGKEIPAIQGKIFEAGGPDVFTYREMMQLVLTYTHRKRPIIPLPWFVGRMQGWLLEKLPENILTLTRDQVEQLKMDNIAFPNALPGSQCAGLPPSGENSKWSLSAGHPSESLDHHGFAALLKQYRNAGHVPGPKIQLEDEEIITGPTCVHSILPTYLSS